MVGKLVDWPRIPKPCVEKEKGAGEMAQQFTVPVAPVRN